MHLILRRKKWKKIKLRKNLSGDLETCQATQVTRHVIQVARQVILKHS